MMKCMHQWAANHGLLIQIPLPMQVEEAPPREDDFEDYNDPYDDYCDRWENMGFINCYCGGDLCVCRHHGEKPCPKCGGF
jgi:hypothetical protein